MRSSGMGVRVKSGDGFGDKPELSKTRNQPASSPSDARKKSKPLPEAAGAQSVKQGQHVEPNTVRAGMHPALLHGKTRSHHT